MSNKEQKICSCLLPSGCLTSLLGAGLCPWLRDIVSWKEFKSLCSSGGQNCPYRNKENNLQFELQGGKVL
jgi:hypothetical protein